MALKLKLIILRVDKVNSAIPILFIVDIAKRYEHNCVTIISHEGQFVGSLANLRRVRIHIGRIHTVLCPVRGALSTATSSSINIIDLSISISSIDLISGWIIHDIHVWIS